jgi:hypothetical protein
VDERPAQPHAEIVREEPRREVVAPVYNEIVLVDESAGRRVVGEALREGLHGDGWKPRRDRVGQRVGLQRADIVGAVEHLPGEVRLVDPIVVEYRQAPYPGRGEPDGHRTAESSGADEQHRTARQAH